MIRFNEILAILIVLTRVEAFRVLLGRLCALFTVWFSEISAAEFKYVQSIHIDVLLIYPCSALT